MNLSGTQGPLAFRLWKDPHTVSCGELLNMHRRYSGRKFLALLPLSGHHDHGKAIVWEGDSSGPWTLQAMARYVPLQLLLTLTTDCMYGDAGMDVKTASLAFFSASNVKNWVVPEKYDEYLSDIRRQLGSSSSHNKRHARCVTARTTCSTSLLTCHILH